MNKNIIKTLKIVSLGIVFSASFAVAQVWTSPTGNPPLGNISAPVNDSASGQIKSGALSSGSLTVFGDTSLIGIQIILGTGGIGTSDMYVSGKLGIGVTSPTVPVTTLEIKNEDSTNGQGVIKSFIKTSSLSYTNNPSPSRIREICSDLKGKLVLCAIPAASPIPAGFQTWSTPGTYSFTVQTGVTHLTIKTWGGGGGGGGATDSTGPNASNGQGGKGGGGGSYSTQTYTISGGGISIGSVLTINVGDVGWGAANNDSAGGPGGVSSAKIGSTTLVSANGGAGAQALYTALGVGGDDGAPGVSGGPGGIGGLDPGCSNSTSFDTGNAGKRGNNGSSPGGGGGGGSGARTCSGGSKHTGGSGGDGASGQVFLSWD